MTYLLAQASAHRIPLRDESVQTCVTSPPYWGLRAYAGEQRFVWGGDAEHAHEWGLEGKRVSTGGLNSTSIGNGNGQATSAGTLFSTSTGRFCSCGAWYGAHFATFPEALPERCIKAGSAAGDVVLDPFNGSGTTGRVALSLGRRYVGLDMSREYLTEQAIARIDPITHTHRTTDQMALPL